MMPFCDLRPHLTRLFLLAQPQTEFYYFPLHSPSAAPFFSPRNPKRNLIFSLCISPRPPRYFSPSKSPKGNFIFNTAYPPHARLFFSPRSPERNFIFNTAYPPSARHFHPRKAPKRILFLTLHSQSAAPFSLPEKPPNGILFSHSTCILPQPRPEAPALHYNIFGPVGRLSPRGAQGLPTYRIHPTIVPEMRCAAPKRRNFPARKRYCRHKSGCRDGHTR